MRKAYLIIQSRKKNRHLWHYFYSKKYSHAYLMIDYDGVMVEYNPLLTKFHTEIFKALDIDSYISAVQKYEHNSPIQEVLEFNISTDIPPRYIPRGLYSCVSIIKSIIGINDWFIITPKQLSKYIKKNYKYIMKINNSKQNI